MPNAFDYEKFTKAIHDCRTRLRASVIERPEDIARLFDEAVDELGDAEEEIRTQNEALFEARTSLEVGAAHFRALFELAPVPYLVTTHTSRILQANVAARVLLGVPANALVGKPLTCFVPLFERDAYRMALLRSASAEAIEDWPLLLIPCNGAPAECRVRVRVLGAAPTSTLAWIITETARDSFDGL